jgi:tetratricopeptide (TPR) repeat protein
MVGEHPVAGVGPGAYVSEFSTAKLALLDRGVPFYPNHQQPIFANAHNEPLEVAAEWGVLGVAALLWALWVVVAAVRRIGRAADGGGRGPARAADAALARGGLAVLVVLSLTHFPFRLALTGYPALLWLAWTLRRSQEVAAGDAEAADEAVDEAVAEAGKGAAAGAVGRVLAWTVVVLLAAALALQTVRAQRLLRASRILNAVERTTVQLAASGRLPPTLLWTNLRLLREAARLDPSSVGVVIAAAGEHLLLAQPEEAEQGYRQALELEPRPEVWLNLGRAQWSRQEREEAVASWTTAVRLAPRMIGQVPAPARQQVHRAAQRSPGWSGDASRGAGDGR